MRALSTEDLTGANVWRVIRREVFVGLINGMICAILINFVGILWFGLPSLGYVIGLAMVMVMVMVMVVAGFAGTVIPVVL